MDLLRKFPKTIENIFSGNKDEIIFFALVFIFILYTNNREARGIRIEEDRSNNTVIILIAAFLFIFMGNGENEDITLINDPV